jgi:hypothetical protein
VIANVLLVLRGCDVTGSSRHLLSNVAYTSRNGAPAGAGSGAGLGLAFVCYLIL